MMVLEDFLRGVGIGRMSGGNVWIAEAIVPVCSKLISNFWQSVVVHRALIRGMGGKSYFIKKTVNLMSLHVIDMV